VTVTVGTQTTINLVTSVPQIPSDGSATATITALVLNTQNQLVSGVAVDFTASSGGLAVTQGTTGANGAATATLTAAGSPENRTITVTASAAGSTPQTVTVQVIGTKLTVTGSTGLIQGAQGTYTVALQDSGGNGIANQTVTLSSAKGNTLSAPSVTTAADGQATFTVTATVAGADTITAKGLGLQATAPLTVSNESFAFTAPTASQNIALGTAAPVTIKWTAGGVAQAGQTVALSASRGTLSAGSVTIGASGTASVTITSTTAGPSVISATGNGVTAEVAVEFIATNPTALNLQASPATVVVQAQSTITATVTDPNGNLVEGQVVDFTLTDITGGSLSVASSTTNAQGQATTVYTASTTTSALNGVQIKATVAGTGVTGSTTLTVGGQTVFLSLGTGNTITVYSPTQFELPYTVQAVDSAGNGVPGITVTFTVQSIYYVQGYLEYLGEPSNPSVKDWQLVPTIPSTAPLGPDETTFDGIPACYPGVEGTVDVPGSVASTDVSSAVTSTASTGVAVGTAAVNVLYPQDHALYVAVKLTATATVSGTQSSTSASFWLPALATDLNEQSPPPPGAAASPYGTGSTCGVNPAN
jgi:hypothetical protein